MALANKRPIIVIKKKGGHGGHHGGAWKVAYADFVTAMMALFIVLWLTSSGEKARKAIAGYFNDPKGNSVEVGSDRSGGGEAIPVNKENIKDLKARIEQKIASIPDLKNKSDQIDIAITPEGMRIELLEQKDGTFFESGSAVLSPTGREIVTLIAKELGALPNRVSTEGHTDAQPYSNTDKYDNWELSTDRANAARRLMQTTGLRVGQVSGVRGFADQQLRVPSNPLDPSNRRVTVIVHYLDPLPPTGFPQSKDATGVPNVKPGDKPAGKPGEKPGEGAAAKGASEGAGKDAAKPVEGKSAAEKPATAAASPEATKTSAVKSMLNKVTGLFSRKAKPAPAASAPAAEPK